MGDYSYSIGNTMMNKILIPNKETGILVKDDSQGLKYLLDKNNNFYLKPAVDG